MDIIVWKISLALALTAVGTILAFERPSQPAVQKPDSSVRELKSDQAAKKSAALPLDVSVATEPNLKIAFIGDVGNGSNQRAVLTLIKSEGVQAVLHQGDFDYHDDPVGFWSSVDHILGADFPYFASVGNHDVENWPITSKPSYARFLLER